MKARIQQIISESIQTKERLLQNDAIIATLQTITEKAVEALKNDHKIWLCGNGGSASDAQHIAAEFTGRFYLDREPLFAEALHVNSSYMTAVANDYSFEVVYERMVKAKVRKGDLLIGLSTSGNSPNIVRAMEQAHKQQAITIAMTGESGGKLKTIADYLLNVPSTDTPRIQESHIMLGHIFCELVEAAMFGES